MSVNPQLSPEQRKLTYISMITNALESIAGSLSYGFGPMKAQELVSPSEEFAEKQKEIEEEQRREIEIQELKKANRISSFTAKIAVIGLLLTALIGGLQLILNLLEYRDSKAKDNQMIQQSQQLK